MYKVLFIDADGTLFDFDQAESNAFEQTINQLTDLEINEELVSTYQQINRSLWMDLEKGLITTEKLRTERFKRLLIDHYHKDLDIPMISRFYLDRLSEGGFLIDGAEEVCKYLSEEYRIIIITNGITEVQKARLAKSSIKEYVEFMAISGEAGYIKPDPRIFLYTLEKIGFNQLYQCLMIGDSLSSDIQGGHNMGIDTCWVNFNGNKNETHLKPTYEINHLLQLKDIL